MKKTPIQQAAALLAAQSRINPTPAQQAASRENGKKGAEHGRKGGRPKSRETLKTQNPVRLEYLMGLVWTLVDHVTGETLARSESVGSLRQLARRTHRAPTPANPTTWTFKN